MRDLSSHHLRRSVLALLLLTFMGPSAAAAAAAADDAAASTMAPCDHARRLVGPRVDRMSPDECQALIDAATEERWQLWLDMALAHQHTGELPAAISSYRKFLNASAARKSPLSSDWVAVREQALKTVRALEAQILHTRGRLRVATRPQGALLSFKGDAETRTFQTPWEGFLTPGEHTLAVTSEATGRTAIRTVRVRVGETIAVTLDLLAIPNDNDPAQLESHGSAVSDAPRTQPSLAESLGWVGVAAGAVVVGIGAVKFAQGQGAIGDAECAGDPTFCDDTEAQRDRLRASGETDKSVGIALWVTGGLLIAGGVTAIALGRRAARGEAATSGVQLRVLTPVVLARGGGVAAGWAF